MSDAADWIAMSEKIVEVPPAHDYSIDQARADEQIKAWIAANVVATRRPRHYDPSSNRAVLLTLGGYAGTGKTTLIGQLARAWIAAGLRVAFATYTGKASSVLEASLARAGVTPMYVGTIHRLVYQPNSDEETGRVTGWAHADTLEYDLIVVDEASMIPSAVLTDLRAYGIPLLCVGDHGQLPPVGEDAGVMKSPDIRLELIHRQAAGNPIIAVAAALRQGAGVDVIERALAVAPDPRVRVLRGREGTGEAIKLAQDPARSFLIAYTNATRIALNGAVRASLGRSGPPSAGDSVICLKNNYDHGPLIANGVRGVLREVSIAGGQWEHWQGGWIKCDTAWETGATSKADVLAIQFSHVTFKDFVEIKEAGGPRVRSWDTIGMLLDFGYAMTCHKSQGSQAERVAVYVERSLARMQDDERRRWLYTAATRAASELLFVLP